MCYFENIFNYDILINKWTKNNKNWIIPSSTYLEIDLVSRCFFFLMFDHYLACHCFTFEPLPIIHVKLIAVYPKKHAHGFCFSVLCCGYTLTDFPISIRLTSLALWQSNDCPSASKATLMNMDKYFTWIHYERLHNHNNAKHNKTVCIFLGIYCMCNQMAGNEMSG